MVTAKRIAASQHLCKNKRSADQLVRGQCNLDPTFEENI